MEYEEDRIGTETAYAILDSKIFQGVRRHRSAEPIVRISFGRNEQRKERQIGFAGKGRKNAGLTTCALDKEPVDGCFGFGFLQLGIEAAMDSAVLGVRVVHLTDVVVVNGLPYC